MLMRLVTIEPDRPGSFIGIPRPGHRRGNTTPRWPGLWPRLHHPRVQRGILLWKTGEVAVVEDWGSFEAFQSADDHVAGGYVFETDSSSWQYAVLTGAGYVFEPVESP